MVLSGPPSWPNESRGAFSSTRVSPSVSSELVSLSDPFRSAELAREDFLDILSLIQEDINLFCSVKGRRFLSSTGISVPWSLSLLDFLWLDEDRLLEGERDFAGEVALDLVFDFVTVCVDILL